MTAAIRPAHAAVLLLAALVAVAAATIVLALASSVAADAPALGKGGFQWTPPPARPA